MLKNLEKEQKKADKEKDWEIILNFGSMYYLRLVIYNNKF